MAKNNQFKLKAILMDDSTSDLFDEGGMRAVRKDGNYEIVNKKFDTEAEQNAYIDGMYDLAIGCWTSYSILKKECPSGGAKPYVLTPERQQIIIDALRSHIDRMYAFGQSYEHNPEQRKFYFGEAKRIKQFLEEFQKM